MSPFPITPAHVILVNIFTTDTDRFPRGGLTKRVQPPASTLVGVIRLADAKYLVEVEATAVSFD